MLSHSSSHVLGTSLAFLLFASSALSLSIPFTPSPADSVLRRDAGDGVAVPKVCEQVCSRSLRYLDTCHASVLLSNPLPCHTQLCDRAHFSTLAGCANCLISSGHYTREQGAEELAWVEKKCESIGVEGGQVAGIMSQQQPLEVESSAGSEDALGQTKTTKESKRDSSTGSTVIIGSRGVDGADKPRVSQWSQHSASDVEDMIQPRAAPAMAAPTPSSIRRSDGLQVDGDQRWKRGTAVVSAIPLRQRV